MGSIDDLVAEYIRLHESIRTTDDLKVEQEFRESFRCIAALPPRHLAKAIQQLERADAIDLNVKVMLLTRAVEKILEEEGHLDTIDEHFDPLFARARDKSGVGPDDYLLPEDMPPGIRVVWDAYWAAIDDRTAQVLRSLGEDELADLKELDPDGWDELHRAIVEDMKANPETVH